MSSAMTPLTAATANAATSSPAHLLRMVDLTLVVPSHHYPLAEP